jgi:hypothetical protein
MELVVESKPVVNQTNLLEKSECTKKKSNKLEVGKCSNIWLCVCIGAAWMHETSQNQLVPLIPKLNLDYYFDDGL